MANEVGVKKPIYKRKWFIVVMVVVVIGIIGAVMGIGEDETTDNNSQTVAEDVDTTEDETYLEEEDSLPDMTVAQENAYESALSYIDFSAFSKQGLIDQLSSEAGEGYDLADAEFAVNLLEENGDVDWNEQAYLSAMSYLEYDNYSKSGLIEQLESEYGEQFTHDQAVYGAEKAYK